MKSGTVRVGHRKTAWGAVTLIWIDLSMWAPTVSMSASFRHDSYVSAARTSAEQTPGAQLTGRQKGDISSALRFAQSNSGIRSSARF